MGKKKEFTWKQKCEMVERKGNIYLNQPVTLFPLKQSLRAAQILWTLFS